MAILTTNRSPVIVGAAILAVLFGVLTIIMDYDTMSYLKLLSEFSRSSYLRLN